MALLHTGIASPRSVPEPEIQNLSKHKYNKEFTLKVRKITLPNQAIGKPISLEREPTDQSAVLP